MIMPFGLDLKSIIVGALLAYFVVPRILGLLGSARSNTTQNAA